MAIAVVLFVPFSTAFADPSPTGRTPVLLWTAERQAVWNRMRADANANNGSNGGKWYALIKARADCTGASCEQYGDLGQWATLIYQITGDVKYADKAIAKLRPYFPSDLGYTDFSREEFEEFVMMYDWLYPRLTALDKSQWIAMFNRWADKEIAKARLFDSDQVVGAYFGMAFMSKATSADNPRASEFINNPKVGGLTATGTNVGTMRNAVNYYLKIAAGGSWIESSEYDVGTLSLLLMGYEGMKTAMQGVDYFPEIKQFIPQLARLLVTDFSPDLKQSFQWSDNQQPHTLHTVHRFTSMAMTAGLTQDDSSIGPYIQRATEDLAKQYTYDAAAFVPAFRAFYTFNPYAASADWRTTILNHYASGQGFVYAHDTWNTSGTFFGAHFRNKQNLGLVDHQVRYFGDFQLYRRGEWALTHPIGYGMQAYDAISTNSMLVGGLPAMEELRSVLGQEFGPNQSYTYVVGMTAGKYDPDQTYAVPPVFLYEWTRSLLYLPSQDKRSDTIVVFDRVNADDPKLLQNDVNTSYNPAEAAAILSAPAVKQWIVHSPVSPSLTPDSVSWQTAGGQNVRITTLLPQNQQRKIIDEKDVLSSTTFIDAERKYQTRISPATTQQWDTFLNVVQAYDVGASLNNQLILDASGAQGVFLARAGQNDTVAVFNGTKGSPVPLAANRFRRTNYRASWTSTTATTDVFLADLKPTRTWTVSVDGRAPVPLAVSASGLATLKVPGGGNHTLDVQVTGADTDFPEAPKGVRIVGGQ